MAAKLARLAYRRLRFGRHSSAEERSFTTPQHRKLQINYLQRKAANLGFQMIEASAAQLLERCRLTTTAQHPACYTHSEIPVGGVRCEFMACGFWCFCWCVWRQFLAGHRIK
jgi:hypothetical protein